MKYKRKILFGVLIIMLICCITTVSATNADNNQSLEESDVIEVDNVDDTLETVEIEDLEVERTGVNNGYNISAMYTVTNTTYGNFFKPDGSLDVGSQCGALRFSGSFIDIPFKNFVINRNIGLYFSNDAVFQNTGFKLTAQGLSISGAKFTGDNWAGNGAVIYINGENVKVKNLFINVTAPDGSVDRKSVV